MQKLAFLFIAIVLVTTACRKDFEGRADEQEYPETFAVVDSIRRDSNNFLSTSVSGNWYGVSKIGFIKGYYVSTDNKVTWKYTTKQTGTFLLNLAIGFDMGNLPIYIKAVDNLGNEDPTPATMVFPVKNSPPTLAFDYAPYLTGKKTSTLPAFRYFWIVNDVDGAQDVSRIEIVLNDTTKPPLLLPGNSVAATFAATHFGLNFDTSLLVYQNNRTLPFTDKLHGVVYNQLNKIYIRSVDRAGSKSTWAIDSIFVKKPVSDFLMVSDWNNLAFNFYASKVGALGAHYKMFDSIKSVANDLPSDVFTVGKVMDFYKKIVWFSNNPSVSLGLAQLTTENFFNNGGRLFMSCEFSNEFPLYVNSFSFTPIRELVAPPSGTILRMDSGEIMYPHLAGGGWPTLKATSILSFARPFYTFSQSSGTFSYDSICRADLLAQDATPPTWGYPDKPSNVMSSRKKINTGKTDFIFVSLALQSLNGNNNIDSFFRRALIQELEF